MNEDSREIDPSGWPASPYAVLLRFANARQLDRRRVRQVRVAHAPIDRTPREFVLAQPANDVDGGRLDAVGRDAGGLEQPLVAVAGPAGLAVAAVVLEVP